MGAYTRAFRKLHIDIAEREYTRTTEKTASTTMAISYHRTEALHTKKNESL